MKSFSIISAALSLMSAVQAHYTFDQLIVNDVAQGTSNTYLRKHQNRYFPTKFKNIPEGSIFPTDADFTCNKGAVAAPNVFTVKAGDKVGLKQAYGGTGMKHPGPSQVYITPVDDATKAASDGTEKWYKIHQSLLCTAGDAKSLETTAWCSWGEDQVWFTVPSTIPNGQYLVRGEQIGLHKAFQGEAEFYYACAQLKVTGNTATTLPGTGVSIPGVYKSTDAAVNFSVYGKSTSYNTFPGPDVIPGGTIRGSADGSAGDVFKAVAGGSVSKPTDPEPTTTLAPTDPEPTKVQTNNPEPTSSQPVPTHSTVVESPPVTTVRPHTGSCSRRARRARAFKA